jgi:hypothetical protein
LRVRSRRGSAALCDRSVLHDMQNADPWLPNIECVGDSAPLRTVDPAREVLTAVSNDWRPDPTKPLHDQPRGMAAIGDAHDRRRSHVEQRTLFAE